MCRLEDEDVIHFLLKCSLLAGSRQEHFRLLKNEVINNSEDGTWLKTFNNDERITTLIIDCRNYSETFMENTSVMDRIEELSIELCYLYMLDVYNVRRKHEVNKSGMFRNVINCAI